MALRTSGFHSIFRRGSCFTVQGSRRILAAGKASRQPEAVVIGGGPSGLAISVALLRQGWENITILESSEDVSVFDPTKGYMYGMDARCQQALYSVQSELLSAVSELSVPVDRSNISINYVRPEGDVSPSTMALGKNFSYNPVVLYIPRNSFLGILREKFRKMPDSVQLHCGVEDATVQITDAGVEVSATIDGETRSFRPSLLVGADGISSAVRKELERADPGFAIRSVPSPSGGLLFKVLSIPQRFPLLRGDDPPLAEPSRTYVYPASKESKSDMHLGLLPLSDKIDSPRTANIIRLPDHKVWTLKTGEEVLDYLEECFPQLPVRKVFPPEEAERFARARPGRFLSPQHAGKLHKVIETPEGTAGVVLIGDACHAFPPDLGQGLTAALEDVAVLESHLSANPGDLKAALDSYGEERMKDVRALIRIMQIGYPWQYNQSKTFRKTLWGINVALRIVLSRLAPAVFSPPVVSAVSNPSLRYSEVLAAANRTTAVLCGLAAALLAALVGAARLALGAA
mmetsp:Transcript_38554/g.91396  ORF Transcript_38554/g.91396 Transcript_38554/m.91396 type:complete len:516 (-) Transcript_38554:37-1584(-)